MNPTDLHAISQLLAGSKASAVPSRNEASRAGCTCDLPAEHGRFRTRSICLGCERCALTARTLVGLTFQRPSRMSGAISGDRSQRGRAIAERGTSDKFGVSREEGAMLSEWRSRRRWRTRRRAFQHRGHREHRDRRGRRPKADARVAVRPRSQALRQIHIAPVIVASPPLVPR